MNTTIAISVEVKEELKEFGTKGESYAVIIQRLVDSAKERQLQDLLMNEENCITVEEALKKAKNRWQK